MKPKEESLFDALRDDYDQAFRKWRHYEADLDLARADDGSSSRLPAAEDKARVAHLEYQQSRDRLAEDLLPRTDIEAEVKTHSVTTSGKDAERCP